jgi:uncharacterized membrane protein YkoI
MNRISRTIAIGLSALGLALTASVQAAVAQSCLDRYQIQEAVASGQIRSLDAVLAAAGVDSSTTVLNVEVCDEGGRLVYIVGVLNPDGSAQNLVLNAQ